MHTPMIIPKNTYIHRDSHLLRDLVETKPRPIAVTKDTYPVVLSVLMGEMLLVRSMTLLVLFFAFRPLTCLLVEVELRSIVFSAIFSFFFFFSFVIFLGLVDAVATAFSSPLYFLVLLVFRFLRALFVRVSTLVRRSGDLFDMIETLGFGIMACA